MVAKNGTDGGSKLIYLLETDNLLPFKSSIVLSPPNTLRIFYGGALTIRLFSSLVPANIMFLRRFN